MIDGNQSLRLSKTASTDARASAYVPIRPSCCARSPLTYVWKSAIVGKTCVSKTNAGAWLGLRLMPLGYLRPFHDGVSPEKSRSICGYCDTLPVPRSTPHPTHSCACLQIGWYLSDV